MITNEKRDTQNGKTFPILTIAVLLLTFYILRFTFVPLAAHAQDEATPSTKSAGDVRDNVRKTIENLVRKKPKAVVGTLSDISDSTLIIQDEEGKESMVATGKETTYFRITDGLPAGRQGKKTEIKFEDLVLSNFTVAMGYKNGNEILSAIRVITYDKNPVSLRTSLFGTVAENNKGTLTIQLVKKNTTWTVKTTNKTQIITKTEDEIKTIKVGNIEAGDRIVVTGKIDAKDETILNADKIYVLPGQSPTPTP